MLRSFFQKFRYFFSYTPFKKIFFVIFLSLTIPLFIILGVFGVQELRKKAAGEQIVFPESFETGTVSTFPEGWSVTSSNSGWGTGWGENKGTARIISSIKYDNKNSLELIGHHANGTQSRLQAAKLLPNIQIGTEYEIEVPVFLPTNSGDGKNASGGSVPIVEVLVNGWSSDYKDREQVFDANHAYGIDPNLKNQWQIIRGTFKFTKTNIDTSKIDVGLAVWNNQTAIFGGVKIEEAGVGKIVFDSPRDGAFKIYTMNEDGSNVQKIITTYRVNPSFSPDGAKIVFDNSRTDTPSANIFTANADGTNQTQITQGQNDSLASFSFGGNKVLFTRTFSATHIDIFVMNSDGSGQVNLTNNNSDNRWGNLSPDGAKIVFSSNRTGNFECFLANADGSSPQNLTNNPADDYRCSFSPDGKKIVFHSNRSGNYEIYSMNLDGTNLQNLTNNSAKDIWPSVSSDGKKIAFASERDGNLEIYVMNVDGSAQTRLTNNAAEDSVAPKAYYRKEGKHIASFDFSSATSGQLPTGWGFGRSGPEWNLPEWGIDWGSAEVEDKVAKTGAKGLEIISHNSQPGVKSSLSQVCTFLTLDPQKKYRVSSSVYIPASNLSGMASILLQGLAAPYRHYFDMNSNRQGTRKIDQAKKDVWQDVFGEVDLAEANTTETSYQLCLQAVNNGVAIYDNVNLEEVGGGQTPTPTPTPTPAPGELIGDVNDDEVVDIVDLGIIIDNYGQDVPPANAKADLNNDKKVDIIDIGILIDNFGKTK